GHGVGQCLLCGHSLKDFAQRISVPRFSVDGGSQLISNAIAFCAHCGGMFFLARGSVLLRFDEMDLVPAFRTAFLAAAALRGRFGAAGSLSSGPLSFCLPRTLTEIEPNAVPTMRAALVKKSGTAFFPPRVGRLRCTIGSSVHRSFDAGLNQRGPFGCLGSSLISSSQSMLGAALLTVGGRL